MIGRRFLLTGGLGLLGLSAVGYGGSLAACSMTDERRAMLDMLLAAFEPRRMPAQVGDDWLARESAEYIVAALLSQDDLVQAALLPETGVRRAVLADVIRNEFSRGQMVVAGNWVVSTTEARLAALQRIV